MNRKDDMDRMKNKGWSCKYEIDRLKNLGWSVQDEMSWDEMDGHAEWSEKDFKNIDFSLWGNRATTRATTHAHISYCTFFIFSSALWVWESNRNPLWWKYFIKISESWQQGITYIVWKKNCYCFLCNLQGFTFKGFFYQVSFSVLIALLFTL